MTTCEQCGATCTSPLAAALCAERDIIEQTRQRAWEAEIAAKAEQ